MSEPAAAATTDTDTQSLRDDVRWLGALLGEVLQEQDPGDLFARVEAVRLVSRRRRGGETGAEDELAGLLSGQTPEDALALVRAFSAYFFVVNMAERIHRIRRAIAYREQGQAQRGGWDAVVAQLAAAGLDHETALGLIARLQLCPVFTAHPTEATRRSLLVKEQRIARALVEGARDSADRTAVEARIRNELTTAWQTEEQLAVRPAVADEVEHILFYLSEVIYRVVPRLYRNLDEALARVYGKSDGDADLPTFLRVASWVGGDMDGNPNVGPDTIRATLARQRELVLRKYRDEVRELFGYLTQTTTLVAVDEAVLARCTHYRERLAAVYDEIPARYHAMPYRILLWFIARRLDRTGGDDAHGYSNPGELLADLDLIAHSLARHRGRHAGLFLLRRLIRRVQTFGFHLATLDVRQHAGTHRRAAAEVLGADDFDTLPAAQRTQLLQSALEGVPTTSAAATDETARVLDVMRAIADARVLHGNDAIGLLIISMAQAADDALAPLLLARAAGAVTGDGVVALDIAPLFETVNDLAASRGTLESLWGNPVYRAHLRQRGDVQYVMLGYSDSNKDAGLAASRWALYQAQTEIVQAAREAGIDVTLFHGRGGSISRGGGKPREAILAEPPGAVAGRLRVTEQGEIIHAKYGLRGLAIRTLELMGSAVLERLGRGDGAAAVEPQWEQTLQAVADSSRDCYRRLVYDHDGFHTYFREATPIDVIERLQIGSRPVSRSGQAGIEDLRAIPWVFSWTQSRHLLPGWFGVGTGLELVAAQGGLATLREMAASWPFFENLLADAEMALAKADLDIAHRYAALCPSAGEEIFGIIRSEYERTRKMILRIRNADALLSTEPVLRRSLPLRNPYVDPMSFVQVDLLRRWRAGGRSDAALERALVASVHGIARGMQNTG